MNAEAAEELAQIVKRLNKLSQRGTADAIVDPLSGLQESAERVGKSASGSWMGYHALVYYDGFNIPPSNAHFDHQWGLMDAAGSRTRGNWMRYDYDTVVEAIQEAAGYPDFGAANSFYDNAKEQVAMCMSETLSILQTYTEDDDRHLAAIGKKISEVKFVTPEDFIDARAPSSKSIATEDVSASNQGMQTPPHIQLLGEVIAMRLAQKPVADLINLVKQAAAHVSRKQAVSRQRPAAGRRIFIGHGHSADWRELKDFIEDRLGLQTDEFNRVPIAGVHGTERLGQMLNSAAMAFLVMTAEDEQSDGRSHARLNVVHEAGLFQGRLGFERAIVLLEEGCEAFSNIDGLGQLRFARGDVGSKFEEIRRVLEREGLVKANENGQASQQVTRLHDPPTLQTPSRGRLPNRRGLPSCRA